MNRPVVPIANMARRLPEAGRLRTGVKTRGAMKAITTWRMTSHDKEAIEQVASIYGGTPQPWTDAPTPGQWEVITESAELHIVLPPDPLGGTPIYEAWSGGGCQRRCDGVTCDTPTSGPDGAEMAQVPCLCSAKGEMTCTPHTRLSVILPDVKFGGTWRYESAKSWNVMQEMPAMVELIQSLQERGLTRALLAIEPRKSTAGGKTKRFVIPVLRVADSLDRIAAGAARVSSISTPTAVAELNAATPDLESDGTEPVANAAPVAGSDDDIVDAELVDDDSDESVHTVDDLLGFMEKVGKTQAAVTLKAREAAASLGESVPNSFGEIQPGVLLDALCAWLRGLQ